MDPQRLLEQLRQGTHKEFPNPTLVDAIAEFGFVENEAIGWQDSWFGEYFTKLGPANWRLEPFNLMRFEAQLRPEGVSSQMSNPGLRMHYHSKEIPLVVQTSRGWLALDIIPPYKGWIKFEPTLEQVFRHWVETTSPEKLVQVTLTYSNHLPKDQYSRVADWVSPSEFLPSNLLNQSGPFLLQYGYEAESSIKSQLILADAVDAKGNAIFILTLQYVWEGSLPPDWDAAKALLDKLRGNVWGVFTSLLTVNYVAFLERTAGGAEP